MSEDWKPGDLAVCVDDRPNFYGNPTAVRVGQTYKVEAVDLRIRPVPSALGPSRCGLVLHGVRPTAPCAESFAAARFRKVKPDTHEPCEEEFVSLLNRTKRRADA